MGVVMLHAQQREMQVRSITLRLTGGKIVGMQVANQAGGPETEKMLEALQRLLIKLIRLPVLQVADVLALQNRFPLSYGKRIYLFGSESQYAFDRNIREERLRHISPRTAYQAGLPATDLQHGVVHPVMDIPVMV